MNDEAAVVNLFFTVRVFLVGAILLSLPHITRKGLLFGTYLGEAQVEGPAAARLRRSWDIGTGAVMAVSLAIGWAISLSGRPVPGNLTGTAVLIVASVALYVWTYSRGRRLAVPAPERSRGTATAPLAPDEAAGEGLAKVALALCIVAALASAAHATLAYDTLPDRIPTLTNLFGVGDGMRRKSLVAVLLFPSYNLVISPFFALSGLLIAGAKRSVRGGSGGRSIEAQHAFRTATSHIFSVGSLFTCALLAVVSADILRVARGEIESLGARVGVVIAAMILLLLASLVRLLWRFGQGGSRLEEGSPEAPLTGGLADNDSWVLGIFYVNRDDPSLIVESRFLGYDFNYGNPVALAMLAVFAAAGLGLIALTLLELGLLG